MLCYQSSRDATDVISDTFTWIADNIKALLTLTLPVAVTIAVCLYASDFYVSIDGESQSDDPFVTVMKQLSPFGHGNSSYALAESIMTLVTTLLTVPLLHRYFAERHSLRGYTLQRTLKAFGRCPVQSVAAAVLMAVMVWGLNVYEALPMTLISMLMMVVIPCLIMGNIRGEEFKWKVMTTLKSMALIVLVCCIIKALPMLCLDLILLICFLLLKSLPVMAEGLFDITQIINLILTAASAISMCAAVVVFLTGTLMLHGYIFNDPNTQPA